MAKRSSASPHMVAGMGVLIFRLHECRSLKSKRSVVKAIIAQIRNHFNASVAEVGANDIYQRAEIGFTMAGSDHQVINAKIDKLINFVDDSGLAELFDSEIEIIHL
jgi:uncharacterized protein YlxP (DUF503 family)